LYSAFSLISTRGEKAGAPSSGNSLIRLPLSRDGQGKIIGEKLERQTQFGRAIVRSEFGHEIIRHKNKIRRREKIPEGVWQEIAERQRSNI
jgi:hypothetical protein